MTGQAPPTHTPRCLATATAAQPSRSSLTQSLSASWRPDGETLCRMNEMECIAGAARRRPDSGQAIQGAISVAVAVHPAAKTLLPFLSFPHVHKPLPSSCRMLDAWDKLPPPQQAPYVDAALAEMGHEAEPTAGRPCSTPASPPLLPRPRQAFPCAAASAAAAAALAAPGVDSRDAAGAVAAPDGQDAAGGLLALSLLSSLAYPALLGNVQAPQDSCPGVAW